MLNIVCHLCSKDFVADEILLICANEHHLCADCGKKLNLLCECFEPLNLKINIDVDCVEEKEKDSTKIIPCVGQSLNIWECTWTGDKKEFEEHFIRCHNNSEIFEQFQVSSVPFLSDQNLSALTIVKAFDSCFLFHYKSDPVSKMIYFIILLLDEEAQDKPESYLYEFMIKSPKEHHCKIKFVEKCYVYDDDIIKLRENELCAVVSYQSLQKHLFEAHIHFSFLLKKNCKETISMPKGMCNGLKKDILIHKTAPYSMPNKGSMKGNNIRKGASVPIVSGIGGGVLKKDTPISIAIQMEEILKSNSKTHPPDYSSINKSENVHTFQSPVHSKAAINRNDEEDMQPSSRASDGCYHIAGSAAQPYKIRDTKMYRQKYPTSCLSKPILKK